jgi:hypothetical protein
VSPTARTLRLLRRSGYVCDVCERWIAQAGVRRDLFGFIDVLAISRREPGILAIQATSLANVSARLAKAKSRPELKVWLQSARFEVWGWGKRGKHWQVRRVAVSAEDLEAVVVQQPPRRQRVARQQELFM